MPPKSTHCIRGHAYAEHGRVGKNGGNVCLKCKRDSRKGFANAKCRHDYPTALSQLAEKWDKEIHDFAQARSAELAAYEYGVELKTVRRLLRVKYDNYQFPGSKPEGACDPARPRG